MKMSKHAINDRMDRMLYISQFVGFGEEVLQVLSERGQKLHLTSTGVLMVKDAKEDFLVTVYVANIQQVTAVYRMAGFASVPNTMYRKVMKNKIHLTKQNSYKGA